jgi:shikimate dehydrogenase
MTIGDGTIGGGMISGGARIAGVIGWPVTHSLSPRLHGFWLRQHGIDGAYVPLAVAPERLDRALAGLAALGLAGANVTVPHKQGALAAVDEASAVARRIGAVNTIIVRPDGRLHGTNTDAFGFLENIRNRAPDWDAAAGPVLVLGAGGAARAVVAALIDAGVPALRLANRHRDRAETLAADFAGTDPGVPIEVVSWDQREAAMPGIALLVNTTSLGMVGQPPLTLDLALLPPAAIVVDIVYTPLITPLLAAAAARGNAVVDGLGMLLHQARPAFAAWFGHEPEVTEALRRFMLQALVHA